MSPRPAAVRGHRAFRALARSRRRAASGPITVHFEPTGGAGGEVRVAFAVGRKVGGAVARNRWRRRLRAIVAGCSAELPPGDYLIGLGPDVASLSFEELREQVIDTMRRASGRSGR